jgi:hypothetical protein
VLALDAQCLRVQDQDALDKIAQLADVARPVVLLECAEGVFGHLDVRTAVLDAELLQEFLEAASSILTTSQSKSFLTTSQNDGDYTFAC